MKTSAWIPRWTSYGPVCLHCATPNPDRGDKCGNCDEDAFVPPSQGTFTKSELATFRAATRHQNSRRPRRRRR